MEVDIYNAEINKLSDYLDSATAGNRDELLLCMKETLKIVTSSQELTDILKEKSVDFNPSTFLETSVITLGDRKALLIPSKQAIPYCVTLMYLIVNGSYSLEDVLHAYYYSPFGEEKECRMMAKHLFLALSRGYKSCTVLPPEPVETTGVDDEDRFLFIKTLSAIRGIISSTKVILDDKKAELFQFTGGMMDSITKEDYKLYKVFSIGFKNTLIGVHQSAELSDAITTLTALENKYSGILA